MMYFRQIATATALSGFLALAGFLPTVPAFANGIAQGDTAQTDQFYDVQSGTYVTIKENMGGSPKAESVGSPNEAASTPSHIQQTLDNN